MGIWLLLGWTRTTCYISTENRQKNKTASLSCVKFPEILYIALQSRRCARLWRGMSMVEAEVADCI